ncbi:MAG: hypothetical protein JOZ13_11195 [Alphaproteobacteria bacterium]|nr:hypothetical protein [Alphaproteobacteria bacterium]
MKRRVRDPQERREAERARAKRAALKALKRTRKAVEDSAVDLSSWEGEFLGSVEGRVERFGRAFRDPEKGGPGAALSMLQAQKLKEIGAKAKRKPGRERRSRPS